MSDATFAVDNAVPILSNAIFMQNLFAMLAFNYAIYFTLPLIIVNEGSGYCRYNPQRVFICRQRKCNQLIDPPLSRRDADCVKTNPPVLSFPRKWVEDSTRRESSLCSQGMDPRFSLRDTPSARGDDTSVDFSRSLDAFGIRGGKMSSPPVPRLP